MTDANGVAAVIFLNSHGSLNHPVVILFSGLKVATCDVSCGTFGTSGHRCVLVLTQRRLPVLDEP